MKILFPHGEVTRKSSPRSRVRLEGRRRVKEQLKKMGSFEYYHTSFSYTLQETGEEKFVGVPEQGGRDLISHRPALRPARSTPPASRPTARSGLYRVEVSVERDRQAQARRRRCRAMKESSSAPSATCRRRRPSSASRATSTRLDLHVEVIDLLANRVEAELGVAFFVAATRRSARRP
jgi:ATP-dependent Lon protease